MRFLTGKFWVLAVFLALFGQFSPLAARFCTMTQSQTLCTEIVAGSSAVDTESGDAEWVDVAQVSPCGHCCQQSEGLVAILYSAPLLSNSRFEIPAPVFQAPAITPSSSATHLPTPDEFSAIYHEIDLPPPPEVFVRRFSCRAPPERV